MPIPTPNNKEKRSDFISRCVSDLSQKGEFKDNDQRVAVCASQFDKAESKASIVVSNPWDETENFLYYSDSAKNANKHYFETKEEALKDAKKLGLKGFHSHKTDTGKTLYMAGPNHKAFMQKHNEIMKEKKIQK